MPASSNKAWVVMPLYYYPLTETTWKPLYDACVYLITSLFPAIFTRRSVDDNLAACSFSLAVFLPRFSLALFPPDSDGGQVLCPKDSTETIVGETHMG